MAAADEQATARAAADEQATTRAGAGERFTARAAALGVEVDARRFPQGTRTAADAAAAIGCDVAQIVKSLVFIADDEPVLALTSGANRVDESRLAAATGAQRVRKATAEEVRAVTGYAIGGTPPFGHDRELTVLCDRDLAALEVVWAAAGTPMDVFAIRSDRLVEVAGARVVDLAG
jgi:prolyl-tRNA editing enzyme YbaK/EbsC (Cys-tRNA(Pro) deacylase)